MFYKTRNIEEESVGLKYYSTPINININNFCIKNIEDFIVQEVLRGRIILPVSKNHKAFLPVCCKGDYFRAILIKKGIDTISAINFISKVLNIPFSEIKFLGLKDARGITCQLISIKRSIECIKNIRKVKSNNVKMLYLYESCAPVSTQELWGNRFTIILRKKNTEGEDKDTNTELQNMIKLQKLITTNHLISYFGYQRFGSSSLSNHIIGRYILRRDYESAIKTILSSKNVKSNGRVNDLNLDNCLKFRYEDDLIELFEKCEKDYSRIFEKLPHIIVKIFLQSYQSFLFNKMINKRIEMKLPLHQAVVGDIVGYAESTIYKEEDIISVTHKNLNNINNLIKKGYLSILYPLLGYATDRKKIPTGEAYEPIVRIIEEEKLCLNDFLFKEIPEISLAGYYRPLTFRVYDFLWSVTKENNIVCKFLLKKGFYASIVLRELIKPERNAKHFLWD